MQFLVYLLARALIACLQALPLKCVALIGQAGGAIGYWVDARHRRVAVQNLERCFGAEKSQSEIRALARQNFRRIGEAYACAVKTASMNLPRLKCHLQIVGAEKLLASAPDQPPQSRIFATGHFGNFELYAHLGKLMLGVQILTTYRALQQPALDRLWQSMRAKSGCRFFERRTDASALRAAMQTPTGLMLGLLVDQHAGDNGLQVPFFGHECSTSAAPAVFALRYKWPLYTAVCFRTGLGQWRIEVGDQIPTRKNGKPRNTQDITADINCAFEAAIWRDPANWFWVHRRWKPARKTRSKSTHSSAGAKQNGL